MAENYFHATKKKLGFFYHNEFSLIPFTTTKTDVKKKRSKLPQT